MTLLIEEAYQNWRSCFLLMNDFSVLPLCGDSFPGFADMECGILRWPMFVIRLRSADDCRLVDLAEKILTAWRCCPPG